MRNAVRKVFVKVFIGSSYVLNMFKLIVDFWKKKINRMIVNDVLVLILRMFGFVKLF